jgi:hypothetical protein
MEKEIIKVEHIWDHANDRWIFIERYLDNKEVGLNYMQGDGYEEFRDNWCNTDKGLSEFYNQMKITFTTQRIAHTEIEFINDVMWTYHNALSCYEDNNEVLIERECKCK